MRAASSKLRRSASCSARRYLPSLSSVSTGGGAADGTTTLGGGDMLREATGPARNEASCCQAGIENGDAGVGGRDATGVEGEEAAPEGARAGSGDCGAAAAGCALPLAGRCDV